MKNKAMKRVLAIAAALTLTMGMSLTAFAAGKSTANSDTTELTITLSDDDGDTDETFSAYRLFDVSWDGASAYNYTINSTYESVIESDAVVESVGLASGATAEEVIAALTDSNVEAFAKAVYENLGSITPEYSAIPIGTTDVTVGYYLLVENASSGSEENDSISLLIANTAVDSTLNITAKEDVPTLEKKVREKDDTAGTTTEWQDASDYDIGDDVPFQLTGTVSEKIDKYDTYAYTFHDNMDDGLTFNNDVTVTIDGTTVSSGYTVVTTGLDDGCDFEVQFADLKACTDENGNTISVSSDTSVVVTYTAKLNDNAALGATGNENTASLEYDNNPLVTGDGDTTGETPEDTVVVFTYELDVNKYANSVSDTTKLSGATFALYKYNADSEATDKYDLVSQIDGTNLTTFTWKGLDAGQYKIVEVAAPSGYQKAEDIQFTIAHEFNEEDSTDSLVLKGLTVDNTVLTVADDMSNISTDVIDTSTGLLPTTGGNGTTLLYILGAALAAGVVIVKAASKKNSKEGA